MTSLSWISLGASAVVVLAAVFGLTASAWSAGQALPPWTAKGLESGSAGSLDPEAATVDLMRFMEERVRRDPESAGDTARLAGTYLQRLRETGSIDYLDLASRAAQASLASVPAARNTVGLTALARTEFASHDFAGARDHAVELQTLDPHHHEDLLSDALLELGDYDGSEAVLQAMARRDGRLTIETETRLARHALLRGEVEIAESHLDFTAKQGVAVKSRSPKVISVTRSRYFRIFPTRRGRPLPGRSGSCPNMHFRWVITRRRSGLSRRR